MKQILCKNKALALLLFLFGYNNLYASSGASCRIQEGIWRDIALGQKMQICQQEGNTNEKLSNKKHAFLYLKIPKLGDEYLKYGNEDAEYNLESDSRKERALPVYIELDGSLLNSRKEDRKKYQVSSKIKEQIILENTKITRRNCTFMALGSEYLFPVPARQGLLSVILYFDYSKDFVRYHAFRKNKFSRVPENYFDQFIHRSLLTEVKFESGKIYQVEIMINPNSALPRGSYNATTLNTFETMNTVPGFTITLKELPPNTKFAFDGKDDIGKTYEEIKKEFILYNHYAEKK